jgi:hypothetical protein
MAANITAGDRAKTSTQGEFDVGKPTIRDTVRDVIVMYNIPELE